MENLSPEENGYESLGELKTFIKGTGKGKIMECEEKVMGKARSGQRMNAGEKGKSSSIGRIGLVMQGGKGH